MLWLRYAVVPPFTSGTATAACCWVKLSAILRAVVQAAQAKSQAQLARMETEIRNNERALQELRTLLDKKEYQVASVCAHACLRA